MFIFLILSYNYDMTLSEELNWRGFANQTTYKNLADIDTKKTKFYFGVDPSADSMTVGNLAAVMLVSHFMKHGYTGYLLVGGATGLIGDPDGKKDERNLKTPDEIASNKDKIVAQYRQLLSNYDFTVVDNYAWFKDIKYLDFLRNIGKRVSTGQMLNREFIRSRLGEDGSGISYAEFSYVLIQAYDFLHLFREYGVDLQLCGADQWGNAVAGVDLIRRLENTDANIYSLPLIINKTTGQKFGKSEEGAVWLDSEKTSVYQFYQFWLNVDDASVIDYLKIYTLLSREEITNLAEKTKKNPQERAAQKTLAHEVTEFVHSTERTASVERVTDVLFGEGDFKSLSDDDLKVLSREIPTVKSEISVVEALTGSQIVASKGEARRLISGGAISVNGAKIHDDFTISQPSLVKKGKNNFILVR